MHLTVQSILVGIGAGTTVAIIAFDRTKQQILCYALLVIISIFAFYLLRTMQGPLAARAEDDRLLPK